MAAVLACGPGRWAEPSRALALWDLREAASGAIEVTVRGQGKPGPKGVAGSVHAGCWPTPMQPRSTGFRSRRWRGPSLTTPPSPTSGRFAWSWKRWTAAASTSAASSTSCCERTPNRKGGKTLRAAIADIKGPAPWLQSELEQAFRELIRASDLPEHEANVLVEGELVDALWRHERVIVELDGFAYHKSRAQFEADRRRDAKLTVAGYRVLRVTQQRLHNEPEAVLADLRALLIAARLAHSHEK